MVAFATIALPTSPVQAQWATNGNNINNTNTGNVGIGTSPPSEKLQMVESYNYDPQTGLLANQTAARYSSPATHILNLSYDYTGANGKRTGQLTKILNNLNHNKDRSYSYDALGRLAQAKGGPSGSLWTQTYGYDRFGNRTSVSATGYSTSNRGSSPTVKEGFTASASSESAIGNRQLAMAKPSEPKVVLPTEQLASKTEVELPAALRTEAPRDISDSSFNLSAAAKPAAQGGPPVFTDDPLGASSTSGWLSTRVALRKQIN